MREEEYKARRRKARRALKEDQMYKNYRAQGDRRFGSPCAHEQVKDGRCVNCLRNVVS